MNRADSLYSPERSPDGGSEISALLDEWRAIDPLAGRSELPDAEPA
jgi:hypothetical protein